MCHAYTDHVPMPCGLKVRPLFWWPGQAEDSSICVSKKTPDMKTRYVENILKLPSRRENSHLRCSERNSVSTEDDSATEACIRIQTVILPANNIVQIRINEIVLECFELQCFFLQMPSMPLCIEENLAFRGIILACSTIFSSACCFRL